ncbi:hypothetical protein CONPUDRAFT_163814 [Coniophora puteana RWD-64-598 SS2]|uniref:GRF-type domain-containing protein n=1 Tax=Coniophora puteana (strain RWD-64-598) TaxID=741705 RepID=A0A5M3MUF6_CONPW|nr:uncharacterized protein CONPUDRAFT_163814 [Coniophora puteana RWD-64-598 SS2]EIW82736.1 hypothetical protein CONPUDRAFT_163814 [Coniophora puteana RWD-64-598 SS2]
MSTSAAPAPTQHSANPVVDGEVVCFHGERARRLVSHTAANPDRVFYRCARDGSAQCKFWVWRDGLPAPPGTLKDEQEQGQQNLPASQPQAQAPSPPPRYPVPAPAQPESPRFTPASHHPQAPAPATRAAASSSATYQNHTYPPQPQPPSRTRAPPPITTRTDTAPTQDDPYTEPDTDTDMNNNTNMHPPPVPTQPSSPVRPPRAQGAGQTQDESQETAVSSNANSFFGLPETPAQSEVDLPLHEAQAVPPPPTQSQGLGQASGSGPGSGPELQQVPPPPAPVGGNPLPANASTTSASTIVPFPRPSNAAPVTPVAQRTLARSGNGHLSLSQTPSKRTPEGRAARLALLQKAEEEARRAAAGDGSGVAAAAAANTTAATAGAQPGPAASVFGQAGLGLGQQSADPGANTNANASASVNPNAGSSSRFRPAQMVPVQNAPQPQPVAGSTRPPANQANQPNQLPDPSPMRTSPQKRPRSPRQTDTNHAAGPSNGPADNGPQAPPPPSTSNNARTRGLLFGDEPTIFDEAPPGPSPPAFRPKPRAQAQAQAQGRPAPPGPRQTNAEPHTQNSDPHSHSQTLSHTLSQASSAPDLDAILGPASPDPERERETGGDARLNRANANADHELNLDPEALGFSAGAENERDEAEAEVELVTMYPPPTPPERGQGRRGAGLYPRLSQIESPGYPPRAMGREREQGQGQGQGMEMETEHDFLAGHETSYETTAEGYETAPLDMGADADGEDSPRRPQRSLVGFSIPENASTLNKSPTKRRRLANGGDAQGAGGGGGAGLMTPPDTGHRSNGTRARGRGGANVNQGSNARAGPSRLREQPRAEGSEDEEIDQGWPMDVVESPSAARGAKHMASGARNKGKGKEREREKQSARRTNANIMEREMSADPGWDGYTEEQSSGKIAAPLFHPSPTPDPSALSNAPPDSSSPGPEDPGAHILAALRTLQALDASGYLENLERMLRATQSSVNARTACNSALTGENADLRSAVSDLEARVAQLTREVDGLRRVAAAATRRPVDGGAMMDGVGESRPQGATMQMRDMERGREEIMLLQERIANLERRFEA